MNTFDEYFEQCMLDVVNGTDEAYFENNDPNYWDPDEEED